ncbi:tail protein X [Actinobacillus lignieresii]|uniref:Phage Tail Protein X n=1 Tax=Actinobacillus lignieresii TaxID=720 RepID=A0A380TV47_ACTLI|nr:tail protein X [Actinobacillus lignieresii]SUT91576.1 Phage Tail Protein X [Actinobacillus lignieresii]VEB25909.1 Phage Tail Protein X [Actinobacillus lignieresii]
MTTITAMQDDTLDALIYREYGTTEGLVELALEYNPQLADMPILEMGQQVEMPDDDDIYTPIATSTVQLWD